VSGGSRSASISERRTRHCLGRLPHGEPLIFRVPQLVSATEIEP
jgi:hypothetical protein